MRFTIDRSTWHCGGCPYGDEGYVNPENAHGTGEVALLNHEGYMCCLGQIYKQLGFKDSEIKGEMAPNCVVLPPDYEGNLLVEWTTSLWVANKLSSEAMRINDNNKFSRSEREWMLVKLFAEHGHEIIFEGEYNGVD